MKCWHLILSRLLHEIQGKLGENQKDQHKKVSRFWKGFTRSTSIGNELARYKDRVNEMRLNFIVGPSGWFRSITHHSSKVCSVAHLDNGSKHHCLH
jgi:hypothetical protein